MIKWRGYSAEESTWEPEKHLNCPAIIAKYNAKIANQDSKPYTNFSDESDNLNDSETLHIAKSTKLKRKKKSNLVVSSPSSFVSMSPARTFSMSSPTRDLSPERDFSKPQGIAQFFRPTAETLPALNNSEDLVRGGIGLVTI